MPTALFLPGNKGRVQGLPNHYTRIKEDILSIFTEEGGKERFRKYFRKVKNFPKAMQMITALMPRPADVQANNIAIQNILLIRSNSNETVTIDKDDQAKMSAIPVNPIDAMAKAMAHEVSEASDDAPKDSESNDLGEGVGYVEPDEA